MAMERFTEPLTIEDEEDAYRLRCPNGHQVTPTNNHWYCRQCARAWDDDAEPELDAAVDAKTGRELRREDVELAFDTPGVYHA